MDAKLTRHFEHAFMFNGTSDFSALTQQRPPVPDAKNPLRDLSSRGELVPKGSSKVGVPHGTENQATRLGLRQKLLQKFTLEVRMYPIIYHVLTPSIMTMCITKKQLSRLPSSWKRCGSKFFNRAVSLSGLAKNRSQIILGNTMNSSTSHSSHIAVREGTNFCATLICATRSQTALRSLAQTLPTLTPLCVG